MEGRAMARVFLRLSVLLVALTFSWEAMAHNLILEAYPFGGEIAGEAFFSDGVLVGEATIEVLDLDGRVLSEVITDQSGSFSYTPDGSGTLSFRLDAGAGHVAEASVEVPDAAGTMTTNVETTVSAATGPDSDMAAALDGLVAREISGLQAQIEDYQARNDFLNVVAAIGILAGVIGFGLFGLGYRIAGAAPRHRGRDTDR